MLPSPKTGRIFDPDSFRHTHEKILKDIGAERIRFHDLKHPHVKHTTKNISAKAKIPNYQFEFDSLGFLF